MRCLSQLSVRDGQPLGDGQNTSKAAVKAG
jgi:hypothetical protein